ncbi:hypothetical protein [Pseudomonas sp.]|uniref:hypothetical protein n=1 Tax=Pseudomonas sp. TaxID=306 RepID=UPI00289C2992|nr:hypothetical protein [Pseudomonas sp.]
MNLNRALSILGKGNSAQCPFHQLQRKALEIADDLLRQPKGNLAVISSNQMIWIAPYAGQLEVFYSDNYSDDREPYEVDAFQVRQLSGLMDSDMEELCELMQQWLMAPVYHQPTNANLPALIAANIEAIEGEAALGYEMFTSFGTGA